jgi:hypothetical protein
MPFDVPPKPKELTAAPSARLLKVRRVDVSLLGDESGEYIDPLDGEEVPMGKRKDWVTPEPMVQESEISEP